MKRLVSKSARQTREFAANFASELRPGDVVALHGDLGSGKTCFVQGLAEGLGVNEVVNSPTYLIMHEYLGDIRLNHIDLYRLQSIREVLGFGFEDCLHSDAVTAIEWPEIASDYLPRDTYHIRLKHGDSANVREITVEHGEGDADAGH